jgi:hypothetical protein
MVARELISGKEVRLWHDELQARRFPPFPLDADALYLAYYATAEFKCHLALGWGLPANVIDLFVEFKNLTNNSNWHGGASLLSCAQYYGVPPRMTSEHKTEMRQLVMGGTVDDHRDAILDYCAEDVENVADIWPKMVGRLNIDQALNRGDYMRSVAKMEHAGVPVDVATLERLNESWPEIKQELITAVDRDYGVFDGSTFKMDQFAGYLKHAGIPWPRTETGRLKLDDDTFRDQARLYPQLDSLRQLRKTLGQLRLTGLAVGPDGRNRCNLSPFRSITSRNQPSNAKWVFGPSAWLRSLIRPKPGTALAYIDWSQQELGIAAALSQDENMLAAYRSGDFYLAFAKQARAVPAEGTKATHPAERERFKVTALAVMYGGSEHLISRNTGLELAYAKDLLRLHKRTYPQFWAWRGRVINALHLQGHIDSALGWRLHRGNSLRTDRTVANFPMQAGGADMLRLAVCYLTDANIQVIGPVHDAVLIEAPVDDIDNTISQARALMAEASRDVLGGRLELRTDVDVVRYPNRYVDGRGADMWTSVMRFLEQQPPTSRPAVCDQLDEDRQ